MWINIIQFMTGIAVASLIIFSILFIVTLDGEEEEEEEDWVFDRNFYFRR